MVDYIDRALRPFPSAKQHRPLQPPVFQPGMPSLAVAPMKARKHGIDFTPAVSIQKEFLAKPLKS